MITQTTNLNLIPESGPIVIHVDQYDEGTGRLIFNLYDNDIAYTPTGTAVIQGTKPDNHGFNYNCTMVGNVVTADLTEQMTAVAGPVRCQIVVTESDGRTGSFAFIIDVQKSALPDDTVMSDSEYQLIQQAIQDTEESAEDAEAWAVGERNGVPVTADDETYHNNSKYWAQQSSGSLALDNLSDVTITSPTDGQALLFDGNTQEWINGASSGATYLNSLTDVTISTPTDGQVLTYDADTSEWINGTSTGATSLNSLTDVTITTVSDGQALVYDGNSNEWINGSVASGLDDLSDVTLSAPTDGQSLVYDSNSGEWVNQTVTATTTLSNLTDVSVTTPADGQVLTYDSVGGNWQNEAITMALPGLSDVTIATPTDGQVLTYDVNSSEWKNASPSSGALNGLTDVTISAPTDDQVLTYDVNLNGWKNKSFSGGGGMNTDGSNAAASVGMVSTKQFLVGDRTNKGTAGTYAYEIGDGAEATGYGAYAEGAINYAAISTNSILSANITTETLKITRPLTTYPYQSYSLSGTCQDPTNWEATIAHTLDSDITLTSGDVTVRITKDGTNIKVYYTNTGNTSKTLYYGYATGVNEASGDFSHAEGSNANASGNSSHAEGSATVASGIGSHAEGNNTDATGGHSHAEGNVTVASAFNSHAENYATQASGNASHAEGQVSIASGTASHAEGYYTQAASDYQHVSGKYNVVDSNDTYAVIVGNGTADNARSNAFTVDWSGNIVASGDVTDGSGNSLSSLAPIWSSTVSCLVGDTTCTITDASILTTSIIEPYSQNSSGTPMGYSSITVTTGQVVLAFDALSEATDFIIKITNL